MNIFVIYGFDSRTGQLILPFIAFTDYSSAINYCKDYSTNNLVYTFRNVNLNSEGYKK